MEETTSSEAELAKEPAESSGPFPARKSPNWPVFGLAVIGMALTAYLTVSSWGNQSVAGCTEGSACDLVLNSRWATLFGLPTSFWGFMVYAAIAAIALKKRHDLHWKFTWAMALFGVIYSIYLTGISIVVLDATCPYCVTSLVLLTAILALLTYQRPISLRSFSWSPWLLRMVTGGVVFVIVLHLHYAGILGDPPRSKAWVRGLAEHLTKADAKFYGASWCPHCIDQKEMFGGSVDRIPYVECSPYGRGRPQAQVCNDAGIRSYPTWVITGERHIGTQTLENLARYSGYRGGQP